MSELIGQNLGPFQLVGMLGMGGMAAVYKGYDQRLERYVAVKVLRPESLTSSDFIKRFEREAKALAQLNHPNIVKIFDYGESGGKPYLVMEYLSGGSLKERSRRRLSYQEAVDVILPIARALSYAHRRNIVHRDIKPANILFSETDSPILTDFGIAKIVAGELASHLTSTGVGMGTPDYMAPEQGMGETVDHRADIYALGVVFYELVTGQKPFRADTPMAVMLKHISEPLPPPRQFAPDLPSEVERVICKALQKKPSDRYQDIDQMIGEIESLSGSMPSAQKRPDTVITEKGTLVYIKHTDTPAEIALQAQQRQAPYVQPALSTTEDKYEVLATSKTPALIIYILDVSSSMTHMMGNRRRIDVVTEALYAAIQQMVFRSTKGVRVAPRYRLAIYAYSDHVYDLLNGIKTVDYVASLGIPELVTMRSTDTAKAFLHVEKLLQHELPNMADCPAPLVCHMTDGEFTGDDPEEIVERIKRMRNPDGAVLVENIFISDKIINENIPNPRQWQGISAKSPLTNEYAIKLRNMSSILPESYRIMMLESGYRIEPGSYMMLPGMTKELVEMGFVMSSATPVSRSK
ncbi:MAG: protein kinase [Anaerolineae bacterium]|nr:protein kinase [Anaerolineae bacterium]